MALKAQQALGDLIRDGLDSTKAVIVNENLIIAFGTKATPSNDSGWEYQGDSYKLTDPNNGKVASVYAWTKKA